MLSKEQLLLFIPPKMYKFGVSLQNLRIIPILTIRRATNILLRCNCTQQALATNIIVYLNTFAKLFIT